MCNFEYPPQYIALAQLSNALKSSSIKYKKLLMDRLVKQGLDVNYAIPLDAPVAQHAPELLGWTALHFAIKAQDEEAIDYIVQCGAKVTATNNQGFSPIRLALQYPSNKQKRKGLLKYPLVESLLKAQYEERDPTNPSCKLGLSHLHVACMVDDARMVEFLLRSGASPDAPVSADSPYLAGFRPVHVAARYCALESLKGLLDGGADLWSREARGLSPLQLLIEYNLELADAMKLINVSCGRGEDTCRLTEHSLAYERIVRFVLARCAVEPRRDELYGLERLHVAAAMMDNAMLLEVLGANPECDVNAAISENSPLWPGYTPLHFAARCGLAAVKILAKRGANLAIPDAAGITPLDLCLGRYEPTTLSEILSLDETLKSVTLNTSSRATLCDAVKALQSNDELNKFFAKETCKTSEVDAPVSLDSPLWPGCTLLHLAVTITYGHENKEYIEKLHEEFGAPLPRMNMWYGKALMYLLNIGADPIAQDARDFSPVHLAFRQGKNDFVMLLLQKLRQKFEKFDNLTDTDGLSLLHISSAVTDYDVARTLLLNKVDANVRTTSELNFKLYTAEGTGKPEIHLNAGSTPLHVAVVSKSPIIKYLIQKGADPLAIDDDGLTPLLLIFINSSDCYTRLSIKDLLSTSSLLKSDAVSIEGLSHFHVACYFNNVTMVKSFLGRFDVNAKINCGLNDTYADCPRALKSAEYYTSGQGAKETLLLAAYAGYTPLHIAVQYESLEVIELLVEWGADVYARNARGMSPLHMALASNCRDHTTILNSLMAGVNMSKCGPVDDYGITSLHIACWRLDVEQVKRLLIAGSDVNAQISVHSPVWPGDAPLHVLTNDTIKYLIREDRKAAKLAIVELLVARGADFTLPNANNVTPLHAVADVTRRSLNLPSMFLGHKLKYHDVNQINAEGLSFIHIACLANNMEMVTDLCMHGVDVNRPIDYFAEKMGGCRPLHFAAIISNSQMVQFLMEKGAKVSAEDCHGCTPLHAFCEDGEKEKVIACRNVATLYKYGADFNVQDVYGRTPLEILVQRPFEVTRAISLMSCGACLNSVNPLSGESLLSTALSQRKQYLPGILYKVSDSDILSVMNDGSTAIHNIVRGCNKENCATAEYCSGVIEELLKRGCPINALDNRGRTALHEAVKYDNYVGVCSLLAAGINANIADNNGKVALSSVSKNEKIRLALLMYLHKLMLLGLEVSEPNRRLYGRERSFPPNEANYLKQKISKEINALAELKLHGSFSLREVMTERAFYDYTAMPRVRREAIVECLASPELYEKFPTLRSPIRYQYRRLLERVDLIEPAKYVLGIIMANGVPELCLDKIVTFLNNEELNVLIAIRKPLKNKRANDYESAKKKVKSESV